MLNLSWLAPSQREDGSVMVLSDIASYRIYYGTTTGFYQNQFDVGGGASVQAQIPRVPVGVYFVVVTVIDTDGLESTYSPEIIVTTVKA
ncbi:MAG TPA: hypothetical protein ENJ87_10690 [Gammaproteobacteria bacterium]|nr:hypothetical protein [Gammaproteobacteria bacterium]